MTETTTLPTEDLRALFDLAVGSLNFTSGFWDSDEVEAARRCATALGIDPIHATPREFWGNYR